MPTNKKHLSPRLQHSSQKAVDAVVVDAIATGGSVVADAATVATSSIAPAAEALANSISSFSPQLLDTNIEETAATAATLEQLPSWVGLDSLDAAGATLGAGGFLAGTIITGIFGNGEARRLNGISKEQSKEIETLTANLAEMKAKQLETETQSTETIKNLEDKIFIMDQQFEESTETLKKDFEQRVQKELETRSDKIKQDLQFKYDIQVMREREQMLQEKLQFVAQESSASSLAKQEETALAKLELAESKSQIATLEIDLKRSEEEKEKLRTMMEESKNPFNTQTFRLQVADLQNDISKMQSILLEKEKQIEETKQELDDLKAKRSNPLYFVKEIFQ